MCTLFQLRCNSLTHLETKFKFSTLKGVSVRLTNYLHWDSCLRWFMEVKNSHMFIQTKTSPSLEITARWGSLPISMVLRSERSLKSKLLSLARTSKYVIDTSVLSIKGRRRIVRTERTHQTG